MSTTHICLQDDWVRTFWTCIISYFGHPFCSFPNSNSEIIENWLPLQGTIPVKLSVSIRLCFQICIFLGRGMHIQLHACARFKTRKGMTYMCVYIYRCLKLPWVIEGCRHKHCRTANFTWYIIIRRITQNRLELGLYLRISKFFIVQYGERQTGIQ